MNEEYLQFAIWTIFWYKFGSICHFVCHTFLDEEVVHGVHGIFVHLQKRLETQGRLKGGHV